MNSVNLKIELEHDNDKFHKYHPGTNIDGFVSIQVDNILKKNYFLNVANFTVCIQGQSYTSFKLNGNFYEYGEDYAHTDVVLLEVLRSELKTKQLKEHTNENEKIASDDTEGHNTISKKSANTEKCPFLMNLSFDTNTDEEKPGNDVQDIKANTIDTEIFESNWSFSTMQRKQKNERNSSTSTHPSKSNSEYLKLYKGIYKVPFSIKTRSDIPSSFIAKNGSVTYIIKASLLLVGDLIPIINCEPFLVLRKDKINNKVCVIEQEINPSIKYFTYIKDSQINPYNYNNERCVHVDNLNKIMKKFIKKNTKQVKIDYLNTNIQKYKLKKKYDRTLDLEKFEQFRNVNTIKNTYRLKFDFFKNFMGKIKYTFTINSQIVSIGQSLKICSEIVNKSTVPISELSISLILRTKCTSTLANQKHNTISNNKGTFESLNSYLDKNTNIVFDFGKTVNVESDSSVTRKCKNKYFIELCQDFIAANHTEVPNLSKNINSNFHFQIPAYLAESGLAFCNIIDISYYLLFEIKLSNYSKPIICMYPITIINNDNLFFCKDSMINSNQSVFLNSCQSSLDSNPIVRNNPLYYSNVNNTDNHTESDAETVNGSDKEKQKELDIEVNTQDQNEISQKANNYCFDIVL
ncbi:hypothetical protein A3Q56_02428 [Intoshia linei]|uniref:Arrestin C-terminal-like domain-containing protein n=1 Tax=Intoshia linei TaxID=1819745 RepID=A0A177B810_9BILA|nr:hypothetical protein A3Q56_02428 [Intoshia linei]